MVFTGLTTRDALLLVRELGDVIEEIEDLGIRSFMQSLLSKKLKQFKTREANESRRVKMLRIVVERANGRVKKTFKFLDSVVPDSDLPKLGKFFTIGCALINAFSPPLFTL